MINPAGFAFENYDALGRYRTTENGVTIDAADTYNFASGPKSFKDAVEWSRVLAESPEAHDCYARNWFTYLQGRRRAVRGRAVRQVAGRAIAARAGVAEVAGPDRRDRRQLPHPPAVKRDPTMKQAHPSRRAVLRGIGGATVGLPLLDVFARQGPGGARRVGDFALYVIHCNGVMQAHTGRGEPEMFWPRTTGPITAASLAADLAAKRSTGELGPLADRILIVKGVRSPVPQQRRRSQRRRRPDPDRPAPRQQPAPLRLRRIDRQPHRAREEPARARAAGAARGGRRQDHRRGLVPGPRRRALRRRQPAGGVRPDGGADPGRPGPGRRWWPSAG